MARGANMKTMTVRPPPRAWLANCLHPTKVVTVSAKPHAGGGLAGPGTGGDGGKAAGGGQGAKDAGADAGDRGGRGTKRGRGEGSGAKFEVTEQDGYIWVQCDDCTKWYVV